MLETTGQGRSVKCDYCNTLGKRFTAIIQDCKVSNICTTCIRAGKRTPKAIPLPQLAKMGLGTTAQAPCSDYLVSTDEGEE